MNRLEVPHSLAGARVEREQTVGEQVHAVAIRTVEIVGGRSGRYVDDAPLLVDRHLAPVVRAADVLVGLLRPRVVAEFAGLRHGVELPHALAGDDVIGADVAWRRHPGFAGGRTHDHQVLPDLSRRPRLHAAVGAFGASQPFTQIDDPVVAEAQDGLAGAGINRLHVSIDREQQSTIFSVGALPVVDAAGDDPGQSLVNPHLLPGRGIEGYQRIVPSQDVHHVVDDDGIEAGGAVRVEPRHFELADVRLLDLIEGDEM